MPSADYAKPTQITQIMRSTSRAMCDNVIRITLYLYEGLCTSPVLPPVCVFYPLAFGAQVTFIRHLGAKNCSESTSGVNQLGDKSCRGGSACAKAANGSSMRASGRYFGQLDQPTGETVAMSKGLNQKKDAKKKPTKSLKERRAEKHAKKQSKG
jgi:hypothetical protein